MWMQFNVMPRTHIIFVEALAHIAKCHGYRATVFASTGDTVPLLHGEQS